MSDLHSLDSIDDFLKYLDTLKPKTTKIGVKPHKYLLILTVCKLLEKNPHRSNKFPFDSELVNTFLQLAASYFSTEKIVPEYPYYHMVSSPIWNHQIIRGKEELYSSLKRFTPKRIKEIIEYSYLPNSVFQFLRKKDENHKVIEILKKILDEIRNNQDDVNLQLQNSDNTKAEADNLKEIHQKYNKQTTNEKSKFKHETQAIDSIIKKLGAIATFVPNYFLHDPSQNDYLECDLVAISRDRIAIIELKHWYGEIDVQSYRWLINDVKYRDDPHISNKYKCQVFKRFYDQNFPSFPNMWVESIVVLTHPDTIVNNANSYKDDVHNLTFDSIETLVRHYKYRSGKSELHKLTPLQVEKIANKLKLHKGVFKPKGLQFPGYEIVDNLTQSPDKAVFLVRPLDDQLQTIKRFRVFIPDVSASPEERHKQRIKAFNGLKAIERVGDHANIIKVWHVHSDYDYVIEASNWSEEGTLQDYMKKKQTLTVKHVVKLIKGVLAGLAAIHKESVIHRDVQPQNILMVKGVPKLMNFDLSYMIEDDRLTVMPEAGGFKPTPYLAPELYFKEDITEATDLFSAGVIFYELICGKLPFKTARELEHTGGVLNDAALEELKRKNAPELIQTVIYELLQRDPDQRPQRADDVIEDLNQMVKEEISQQPSPPNRILNPGETSSVYDIVELIGEGRQSQVYRAKQASEREVAIKLFNNDILKERILSERKALARCSSPYIVTCETIDQWAGDKRLFLVLNLIKGRSLRHIIDQKDSPDINTFTKMTHCLLEAVACLHDSETYDEPLLHNDIKPENIIISASGDPVLIDFGTAMTPRTDAYMGTQAYVAPDLIHGPDLEFCISGDLFALGVTLYEWLFGDKPYPFFPTVSFSPSTPKESHPDLSVELKQWLLKAVQPVKEKRFSHIDEMKTAFEQVFAPEKEAETTETEAETPSIPVKVTEEAVSGNPFVTYLNRLHNTTPENEYALAESQALSPFFGKIHAPLIITEQIYERLLSDQGGHVILTGHAGDGKSTISLELFKRLSDIPFDQPIEQPLKAIEKVTLSNGGVLNIVKDMSELAESRRKEMFFKAFECDLAKERWLIVSNTGALLNTLQAVANDKNQNPQEFEDGFLKRLEKREFVPLDMFTALFEMINLTQIDNIHLSTAVFQKIINPERWESCQRCEGKKACPIYINMTSLHDNEALASERIALIYRRLDEYGNRLTMRQMTAHIAYAVTGGLDCQQVTALADSTIPPPVTDFLFFNRFLGFKSEQLDETALQLKAVKLLQPLELGSKPFAKLDRRLWTIETGPLPQLPPSIAPVFESLCKSPKREHNGSRHRQQLRRLLYFHGIMPDELQLFPSFFLDTPMLIESETWQQDPARLTSFKKGDLLRKVLHVLQEQFTGFHLPENINTNEIYITLNRKNDDLRQSVQIVLAKIPYSNFSLEPEALHCTFKPERFVWVVKENYSGVGLRLNLPFLDFIIKRHAGELGQGLNASYAQRLERFKANLLRHYHLDDQLEVLELKNTGSFQTKRLVVNQNQLEVA